jgi:hypothetical protein
MARQPDGLPLPRNDKGPPAPQGAWLRPTVAFCSPTAFGMISGMPLGLFWLRRGPENETQGSLKNALESDYRVCRLVITHGADRGRASAVRASYPVEISPQAAVIVAHRRRVFFGLQRRQCDGCVHQFVVIARASVQGFKGDLQSVFDVVLVRHVPFQTGGLPVPT